ncbi:hypothetical protein STCU_11062 [Strigomonas culicis]|uniref:Uncharacterized protein n=1 Tax=Strigomonas culicis TaxID=28005 RepID=S9TK04_9TRYP|nr:hypothetical protein STCU_11062 [Strigomonas culicis]|eukprot:EPY16678.1 hypothetical protein STCU_11062 [Strigomonas culicis]
MDDWRRYRSLRQHVCRYMVVAQRYQAHKRFLKTQTHGTASPAPAGLQSDAYVQFLATLQAQLLYPHPLDDGGASLAWVPAWIAAAENALYDPGTVPGNDTSATPYEHLFATFDGHMMRTGDATDDVEKHCSSPSTSASEEDDDTTASATSGELKETCAALDAYFEEDRERFVKPPHARAEATQSVAPVPREQGALNPLLFGWIKQIASERT